MTVEEIFAEMADTNGWGDDIWIVASALGYRASRFLVRIRGQRKLVRDRTQESPSAAVSSRASRAGT
jgi:hypothetical protein